jgi:hypothetical protein
MAVDVAWFRRTLASTMILALSATGTSADEVSGTVTSVDADSNTIQVAVNGSVKDQMINVPSETVVQLPTGKSPKTLDLEKLRKRRVTITHEKNVASKIVVQKRQRNASSAHGKKP